MEENPNKTIDIERIDKVASGLNEWVMEDQENRGIIFIAIQKDEDGKRHVVSAASGIAGLLVEGAERVLNDKQAKSPVTTILHEAFIGHIIGGSKCIGVAKIDLDLADDDDEDKQDEPKKD